MDGQPGRDCASCEPSRASRRSSSSEPLTQLRRLIASTIKPGEFAVKPLKARLPDPPGDAIAVNPLADQGNDALRINGEPSAVSPLTAKRCAWRLTQSFACCTARGVHRGPIRKQASGTSSSHSITTLKPMTSSAVTAVEFFSLWVAAPQLNGTSESTVTSACFRVSHVAPVAILLSLTA